jgi:hypothetical protein
MPGFAMILSGYEHCRTPLNMYDVMVFFLRGFSDALSWM